MAKRRRRRRRSSAPRSHRRRRRSNPFRLFAGPRHHRKRRRRSYRRRSNGRGRRRNPSLASFASGHLWKGIAGAGVGFLGARFIPQNVPFLKQYNTGFMGYGLNIASGAAVAWLVGKWDRSAGYGALIGTGLAVIARFMSDSSMGPAASMQLGDADADLGYYLSDRFPFAQGSGGPYDPFPGSAYLATPPFPTTSAAAVRAGAAAAAAALPAAVAPAAAGAAATGVATTAAARWDGRW